MPHNNHLSYEFGPYRLDPNERVLTRAGDTISLTPKAIDILLLLVVNAGQLVEKDALLQQVWPDTFVEESNLSQNIFTLRRALGDERAGPRYIETVVRRGYRFVATVRVVGPNESPELLAPAAIDVAQGAVIAVLPFINASRDQEVEYLADGVTDNLINSLARVSKLRVMSRSAIFRYKTKELDPQQIGRELGASAVLVGKINSRPSGMVISVELVEAATGWQLWGESFDCQSKDILEIQDAITRQLLCSLKLQLSGDEEKRVTARYTENAAAYQAYLEGRYHWSRYTRKGIEKAIGHFRQAIDLDPNYALAYAGIIDCYLRLATNYLPPEDDVPRPSLACQQLDNSDPKVKLRFEWDWKGAERELRRANELKTDYPSPHQWYAAYRVTQRLYEKSSRANHVHSYSMNDLKSGAKLASQIPSLQLTPTEEVQILCSIAREQLAVGNFEAGSLILQPWFQLGKWPKLDSFNPYAAADLLFTLGTLIGCVAGAKRVTHGQKQAEAFLSGSVALFEQLGTTSRSVEARVELARCFYRQGLFDVARETLSSALSDLPDDQTEIKSVALVLWGVVERDSGRLMNSLVRLREASTLEVTGRLVTGRCYHELATTLKELAISEKDAMYSDEAKGHFLRALHESEAIGNHRLSAAVENNMGFLLLSLGLLDESEKHLLRSRRLFDGYSDSVRGAQVNETLTRLYLETKQYSLAQDTIELAIETLELTDGEALLAEALTTKGVVARRLERYVDAQKSFEAAYRVAERCGDNEGAGRALLIMFEEMGEYLQQLERIQVSEKLKRLFAATQQTALLSRVEKSIAEIALRSKG
jgi:DNA-binding winged helix-turn-helix (wHTH) protein/tetratricopeptide (TPR) repeat protein